MTHTILDLINRSADYLKSKGSETSRLDAELLLAETLSINRVDLYVRFEQPLNGGEVDRYRELIRRRGQGEPVAYILGRAAFRNLIFRVDPHVLVPRPETEHVVEAVLVILSEREWARPPAVLDVGTGSGAIAVALAHEYPDASYIATDASAEALQLARENADAAGVADRVEFTRSDMFAGLDPLNTFDVIVSNPPYIADDEWPQLPPDVREFEPEAALRAGADGLDYYRLLAAEAPQFLKPRGCLVMEIGHTQGLAVSELLKATGRFAEIDIEQDYGSRDRVVIAARG